MLLATASQIGPVMWRATGSDKPYVADYDELLYAAILRNGAEGPVAWINPFDVAWSAAPTPVGRLLPQALGVPVRLGLPIGPWTDAARWAGGFASAYALIQLGAIAASPSVGAAAATLVLLDPSALHGKPLLSLLGIGVESEDWPHQLPLSRLYSPSLTLPFFLAAVLALLAAAPGSAPRRSHAAVVAAFAGVGLAANFFFWTGLIAVAAAVVLGGWRSPGLRRAVAIGAVALALLLIVNALGDRGVDATDYGLRIGFVRTRMPQFLAHAGFWLGAAAAGLLALGSGQLPRGARVLGRATLAVWILALVHTPLSGWDVQSFHYYGLVLAPLIATSWCVLGWHVWLRCFRMHGAPRVLASGLVGAVALLGPFWSARGAANSVSSVAARQATLAAQYAARGAIPDRSLVLVPEGLRAAMGAETRLLAFAHGYLSHWALPDSTIWNRSVCAAVLLGQDSAEVARAAMPKRPGIPIWSFGRPRDFALPSIRSYAEVMRPLADRLGADVAAAAGGPRKLSAACREGPEYALVLGRARVRRSATAARGINGRVRWMTPDSAAMWLELPEAIRALRSLPRDSTSS